MSRRSPHLIRSRPISPIIARKPRRRPTFGTGGAPFRETVPNGTLLGSVFGFHGASAGSPRNPGCLASIIPQPQPRSTASRRRAPQGPASPSPFPSLPHAAATPVAASRRVRRCRRARRHAPAPTTKPPHPLRTRGPCTSQPKKEPYAATAASETCPAMPKASPPSSTQDLTPSSAISEIERALPSSQ